jgi:hypothetical protein
MPRFAGRVSRYAWRRSPHGRASLQPAAVAQWMVGARSFNQGSADTSDIQPSGPAGYVTGGIYGVDPAATALPSGMTLSDAGVLFVGSATAGTTNGVVFSYHEPGALPTFTLHPNATGTLPYVATVYPVEGAVPAGQVLVSPDDANLRSSVLSAWPDGSAQVVVLAGARAVTSGVTQAIRVRPGAASGAALTTAAITAAISSIGVNFGTAASITNFGSPDRVWWANAQTICARYRLTIPGKGVMEAVIDVHAFAGGQAWVEVVVENSRMNSASPSVPTTQTYTNATVSVNGTTVATVSSPTAGQSYTSGYASGTYAGGHEAFRAWYCSAKIVSGAVTALTTAAQQAETFGIAVTHDAASLRAHPAFWSPVEENTLSLAAEYSNATLDQYAPWKPLRVRVPGMGSGAWYEEISPYTRSQAHYFQTGDKAAAQAAINHALGVLCCTVNYRDSTTNLVPSVQDMAGKSGSSNTWPVDGSSFAGTINSEPKFESAHQPTHGVVAFLCRPSPAFIEIAQKIMCWNVPERDSGSGNGSHSFDQPRGRAWRTRNYAQAIFLTPDALTTWKTSGRTALNNERVVIDNFLNQAWNLFGIVWDWTAPTPDNDQSSSRPGYQHSFFQQNFMGTSFAITDNLKVLRDAEATAWATMTDRILGFNVRWINDAQSYEWRAIPYQPTVGVLANGGTTIDMAPGNLCTLTRQEMSGTVPASPGVWLYLDPADLNYNTLSADTGGTGYAAQFFAALATAAERDISGAATAWNTVVTNGGINNLSTWRQGFRTQPQVNRWPRNK